MRAIDADCILVVEAPNHKTGRSTVDMLERFANEFGLRAAQAALGFTNDTQQELAFLYDPHRCSIRQVPMSAPDFPRLMVPIPLIWMWTLLLIRSDFPNRRLKQN